MSPWIGSSVPTVCHFRCRRSAQVDKEEHEASEVLTCPLPDCNYVWCKACQRPIATTNGSNTNPPHSCDGAAELRHLMQQQGWKFCPSTYFSMVFFPVNYHHWQIAKYQSRGLGDAAMCLWVVYFESEISTDPYT